MALLPRNVDFKQVCNDEKDRLSALSATAPERAALPEIEGWLTQLENYNIKLEGVVVPDDGVLDFVKACLKDPSVVHFNTHTGTEQTFSGAQFLHTRSQELRRLITAAPKGSTQRATNEDELKKVQNQQKFLLKALGNRDLKLTCDEGVVSVDCLIEKYQSVIEPQIDRHLRGRMWGKLGHGAAKITKVTALMALLAGGIGGIGYGGYKVTAAGKKKLGEYMDGKRAAIEQMEAGKAPLQGIEDAVIYEEVRKSLEADGAHISSFRELMRLRAKTTLDGPSIVSKDALEKAHAMYQKIRAELDKSKPNPEQRGLLKKSYLDLLEGERDSARTRYADSTIGSFVTEQVQSGSSQEEAERQALNWTGNFRGANRAQAALGGADSIDFSDQVKLPPKEHSDY